AGVGRRTDHALGVDAIQRAVGGAALDGLTAVVERQRRVQSLVVAAVHDISQAGAVDRLVDLDVVVVQAQAQARHERRLPDGADGPGVGFFRPQIRVAARLLVDLARVRRSHITNRAQRHAGQTAQVAQRAGRVGVSRVDQVQLARIDRHIAQAGDLRVEQLADVRGAGGALIHGADADVLDRQPVAADLVAAVLGLGAAGLVLGLAVTGIQVQAVDERQVLDQRHRQFGEGFTQFELTVAIRNRRAGAQDLAVGLRRRIAARRGARPTPFGAEGHGDLALAPRAGQAFGPQTRDRARGHVLLDRGFAHRRQVDVVDHFLRDRAFRTEDVDRHAARHGGGGARNQTFGRRYGVQGVAQLGQRTPVTTRQQLLRLAVRDIGVVVPVGVDVATDAGQQLDRLVLDVDRTGAHLGETTVDGQVHHGVAASAGDALGRIDQQGAAELLAHGVRDERVADRHLIGVAEGAARRVVQRDVALDVGQVAVDFSGRVDLEAAQTVDLIAAQRRLIQVVRVVVVARRVVVRVVRADQSARGRVQLGAGRQGDAALDRGQVETTG